MAHSVELIGVSKRFAQDGPAAVSELSLVMEEAASADLDLVFLIAPNTTDERVRDVDQKANGFV